MVYIVVSSWQLFLQEQVRNSQSPRGCSLSLCQKLSDPCHPYFLITMGGDRWQYNTLGFVKHWRMWYWSILSCLGTHEDLGETCEVRRNIAYGVEQWKAPPAVPYCSSQLPGGSSAWAPASNARCPAAPGVSHAVRAEPCKAMTSEHTSQTLWEGGEIVFISLKSKPILYNF